nr:hypothetical protein [Tanacetum cinerariifolium]
MLKQREKAANLVVQKEREEQAVQSFTSYWNFSMNNDDEEHFIQYKEYSENSFDAIAPVLPTKEPEYSLNDTSDDESECDVPVKDEFSPDFTTFSNPIFDDNDDFTSSDNELLFDEDVLMEDFKVYLNPLIDDEEINSDKIDPHYLNVESDFIESLSNRDIFFKSSSKFDYLEEFSGELMPTSIVNEERIRKEYEEYISFMEKLLAINSFPRPLENFHVNTIVETLPSSPIPVEYGDSQREEIDIFTSSDDLLPPGIESDDYDSEGDIHFLEELLVNDSISLPENESSNFDHNDDPSFPRPPSEPPEFEFLFDFEPNSEEVISDELIEDECFDPGGTDLAKITTKWPKPDEIEHEIEKISKAGSKDIFVINPMWHKEALLLAKDVSGESKIAHLKAENCTKSFVKEAQQGIKRIATLAIRVTSNLIQRPKIKIKGRIQKDWGL